MQVPFVLVSLVYHEIHLYVFRNEVLWHTKVRLKGATH